MNFEPSEVYIIKLLTIRPFPPQVLPRRQGRAATSASTNSRSDPEPTTGWRFSSWPRFTQTAPRYGEGTGEAQRLALSALERKHLELRIRAARTGSRHATRERRAFRNAARARGRRHATRVSSRCRATPNGVGRRRAAGLHLQRRAHPIDQPSAFKAIYRVLLDRDNGPKAGNFSFLDVTSSRRCLSCHWTSLNSGKKPASRTKLSSGSGRRSRTSLRFRPGLIFPLGGELPQVRRASSRTGPGSHRVLCRDVGRKTPAAVLFDQGKGLANLAENESQRFNVRARQGLEELEKRLGIEIRVET